MKSIRILAFVFVAALFVAGYAVAQDCGSSCEKCPVTGKTGECASGKAVGKEQCPVTGKAGECTSLANAQSNCDSGQSCCGTCQGDAKLAKKNGECKTTLAKNGGNQTLCPVSGAKINKQVFVDYKGKRVYMGCKACPDKFKKNADAYVKKMEQQGIIFAMAPIPQTLCPVSGAKINKNVFVDYKGKRVYLGCKACPDKFKKNADAYVKKMEQQGVVFAMAPAPAKAKSLKKAGAKMKTIEKAGECCGSCEGSKSCSGEKKSECGSSCESKKIDN